MNFGALIKTLETEVDIYKNFTEIEGNKTVVIVNGDIEKLDEILNTEHMLHMKVQGMEKKRIEIMKSLNLDGKTLTDVIGLASGEEKEKLSEILEDLNVYTDSLRQINDYNVRLVKSRLDIISSVTQLYKDSGGEKDAAPVVGRNKKSDKIYGKNAKVLEQASEFEAPMINKKI